MLVVEDGGCGAYKQWEFYDTIAHSSTCKVRFFTADIGQKMVFHCHFLQVRALEWTFCANLTATHTDLIPAQFISTKTTERSIP